MWQTDPRVADVGGRPVAEVHVAAVAGVDVDTRHRIGGRRVPSPETFTDSSPIDGSVLAHVARAGRLEVGAAVAAARAELGLATGSVTALIDRLAGAGYVTRGPAPGDRRKVMVQLEPATWQAFAQVYGPCGRAVTAVAGATPAARVEATREVLAAVTDAVRHEAEALRRGDG